MTLYIAGKFEPIPNDGIAIDTTSNSRTWSRGLSPFFLGPLEIVPGLIAQNVENAWQFSKVYKRHLLGLSAVRNEYFDWALAGFKDTYAHRYPMGKSAKPECSIKFLSLGTEPKYSNIKMLSYIEARKELYIPLYSKAVGQTEAYHKLKELIKTEERDIYLQDFDGFNHKTWKMDYQDVIDNPRRKMGHAFVLGMMLEGFIEGC